MDQPIERITSEQCLQAAMDRIKQDPKIIRNHITLSTPSLVTEFNKVLLPAVYDSTAWFRTRTARPKPEGDFFMGSDKVVRYFENEVWVEQGRVLEAVVTEEHHEIIDIEFIVRW